MQRKRHIDPEKVRRFVKPDFKETREDSEAGIGLRTQDMSYMIRCSSVTK